MCVMEGNLFDGSIVEQRVEQMFREDRVHDRHPERGNGEMPRAWAAEASASRSAGEIAMGERPGGPDRHMKPRGDFADRALGFRRRRHHQP